MTTPRPEQLAPNIAPELRDYIDARFDEVQAALERDHEQHLAALDKLSQKVRDSSERFRTQLANLRDRVTDNSTDLVKDRLTALIADDKVPPIAREYIDARIAAIQTELEQRRADQAQVMRRLRAYVEDTHADLTLQLTKILDRFEAPTSRLLTKQNVIRLMAKLGMR